MIGDNEYYKNKKSGVIRKIEYILKRSSGGNNKKDEIIKKLGRRVG